MVVSCVYIITVMSLCISLMQLHYSPPRFFFLHRPFVFDPRVFDRSLIVRLLCILFSLADGLNRRHHRFPKTLSSCLRAAVVVLAVQRAYSLSNRAAQGKEREREDLFISISKKAFTRLKKARRPRLSPCVFTVQPIVFPRLQRSRYDDDNI